MFREATPARSLANSSPQAETIAFNTFSDRIYVRVISTEGIPEKSAQSALLSMVTTERSSF